MILSVSRRTDIPTYYSKWLMNRLKAGLVYVRNPMNAKQVSSIPINPEVVDCIVFWSKNPKPLMKYLAEIDSMDYKYYFQFTLTPYDRAIEKNLPDKSEIEATFIELSQKTGKEKLVWRYDPIFLNAYWTIERHTQAFEDMADRLAKYADECIISFIDPYQKTTRQMGDNFNTHFTLGQMMEIAEKFSAVARKHELAINTCAEGIDLNEYGIGHASCIDRERIERIIGGPLSDKLKKDGQRGNCQCIECIDIGAYDTCRNGCLYCYATVNKTLAEKNYEQHDPNSALLIGDSSLVEKVSERKVKSFRDDQLRLL